MSNFIREHTEIARSVVMPSGRMCGLCTSIAVFLLVGLNGCAAEQSDTDDTANLKPRHENRLIHETSPYLLQHSENPVNWYPWGDEALQKAKAENKPIFLSVGYASCHWCHVMERESFENEEIAALLNQYFVSIKVDREERPDIDHIYMSVTTLMTGRGGWPMTVFLTPDLKPFYSGTYFPPEDRNGQPGLKRLITELARIFRDEPARVNTVSREVFRQLQASMANNTPNRDPDTSFLVAGANQLLQRIDPVYSGFGTGHKFPQATQLGFLLRRFHSTGDSTYLRPVIRTLEVMQRGGIFDQVGGGFHRYTVDRQWMIPHFEKMLYDNALLTLLYVEAYQLTKEPSYLETVTRTLDFLLREMRGTHGEFFSAIDADSEGEEGRFYIWESSEIDRILGARAEPFKRRYGVTQSGNFEGRTVLHLTAPLPIASDPRQFDSVTFFEDCSKQLLTVRSKRIRPLTDDKALTSWNGLALSAFCRGYRITGDKRYLHAARTNALFVESTLYHNGHLLHSFRDGRKCGKHFLEDYAYYLSGLVNLIEIDTKSSEQWLDFATALADSAISLFLDNSGNLFLREANARALIVRPQDVYDGATPAPGSVFIEALLRLHRLTEREQYHHTAEKCLSALSSKMTQAPASMTSALLALDYLMHDKIEIVLVGGGPVRDEMVRSVFSQYLPNVLLLSSVDGKGKSPLFEGRDAKDDVAHAYVCVNSVCRLPATSLSEFKKQLNQL